MRQTVLRLVYCRQGGTVPTNSKPVLCLFRKSMGNYNTGEFKICSYVCLPNDTGFSYKWVEHNTIGHAEVLPYAWLETQEVIGSQDADLFNTLRELGTLEIQLDL